MPTSVQLKFSLTLNELKKALSHIFESAFFTVVFLDKSFIPQVNPSLILFLY